MVVQKALSHITKKVVDVDVMACLQLVGYIIVEAIFQGVTFMKTRSVQWVHIMSPRYLN